jgi:hypothetical protein
MRDELGLPASTMETLPFANTKGALKTETAALADIAELLEQSFLVT